ncbi:hypothetical protein AALP_AA6G317100 [Arabis alpina]|uniref:SP-RING-type domain-containing protein n=1 Tax=Arabis alpina TaxID=50452 RepID=A0A087GT00_ARAAL|nr:hypothetical protein AALP_AA6G317100 [Arabis alpina]
MSSTAAIPVTGPGLPEKAAAAIVNSFRLASVTQRLRYHIQAGPKSDVKEFQICCISLAKGIDFAIANNEIPKKVEEFPLLLKQVCKHRTDVYTTTAVTVLMISVKHACQLGWFSDTESQELTDIADEMRNRFGSFGNICPGINSPGGPFSQIMERFYPFVKVGHVLVSLEVKAGYKMLAHDFHISKRMPHSPLEKIRLFVAQTDNIDTSACIVHPPEVSFLLNGKGLEKRLNITMDSGPQLPSNVTALLKYGTNLLQVMGNSKGNYVIIIAFTGLIMPPEKPVLKDYLQSEVIESSADSDIIEGPSRVSLSCPISRKRIKLPIKGQLCKHLQCFDFWNYFHINMRNPSWRCPHCNQPVCYPEIRLDQNMVKILKEVGRNAADVVINADGTWKVAKEIDGTEEPAQDVIIHDLEDPITFLDSSPVVLDLTGDDDDAEMEIFGDGKVVDRKPCLSDAQGQSNTNDASKDASDGDYGSLFNISDVISLDQVILDSLNTGTGQDYSSLPQIPMPQDPTPAPVSFSQTPSPRDRQATSSPRWNQTNSSPAPSLTTSSSQSRSHPVPVTSQSPANVSSFVQSPPIPRVLNTQPNSYFNRSLHSNHQRQHTSGPTVQSVSRASDLTSNHGSTQRQHTSGHTVQPVSQTITSNHGSLQRQHTNGHTVQSVSRTSNHGSTQRQHLSGPTVQSVTRTSDLMDVDPTTPDTTNWRPRMRGSITPGSYSPALDHMIIRPTQQSQTRPPGSQPVQTPPVQTSQPQLPFPTATFRPETVLVNQNLPVPAPPGVTNPSGPTGP